MSTSPAQPIAATEGETEAEAASGVSADSSPARASGALAGDAGATAPLARSADDRADTGAPDVRSRLGVLRHRHYRNVWFGAFGSNTGTWMEGVGVQWLMAQQTGSALMMGYLAVAQLGPILLLGLVGGLAADQLNRKRLLFITQFGMMLIAGSLAIASYEGWATPRLLIALMALQGVISAFNFAAWQVLTPRLVPREELTRTIALNGMQFNMARVVGPALAGVLMARYGPTVLFAINTLSFLGVLAAIASTPDAPAPAGEHNGSAWSRIGEAARFVFREKGPRAAFLAMTVFSLLAAPLLRMLPLFVSEVYQATERAYGLLLAIMGAGAVCGGFLLKLVPAWYPKHHLIPLSVGAGGLSMALFSAAPTLAIAAPFLFASGVFWLWAFTTSNAAMQLLVEDRMRGRVASICNTAVFGVMPLGSMIAGLIGEVILRRTGRAGLGVQAGVGALAAALAVAGIVMLIWRTPEVDGIRPGAQGFQRRRSLLAGVTASAHRPGK